VIFIRHAKIFGEAKAEFRSKMQPLGKK